VLFAAAACLFTGKAEVEAKRSEEKKAKWASIVKV